MESYFLLKDILNKNRNNEIKTVFISHSWRYLGTEYNIDALLNRGVLLNFYDFNEFKEILTLAEEIDPNYLKLIHHKDFFLYKHVYPPALLNFFKNSRYMNKKKNDDIYKQLKANNGFITGIWGQNKGCIECLSNEVKLKDSI